MRGFGFTMCEEELARVNAWRAKRYDGTKPELTGSPGVRFLEYGKNRDGYWTAAMFAEQL